MAAPTLTRTGQPRYGMVIDTRKCVGCMDCVVACQTENGVPHGYCRDWITTEVRGGFPPLAGNLRSSAEPLRQPAARPAADRREPRRAAGQGRAGHGQQVAARPASACPARRRLCAPGRVRGQVHVLSPPHERRQGPGCVSVCPTRCMYFGDLDDPKSRSASCCAPASGARCCPSGHGSARVLPHVRDHDHARDHHHPPQSAGLSPSRGLELGDPGRPFWAASSPG